MGAEPAGVPGGRRRAGGIRREVLGRAAVGPEREELWRRWREVDKDLDGFAALRENETAVVVLEPRTAG